MNALPPLREELILDPGPPHADGSPTWTIHDPSNNRFYRIGWHNFELLSRWHLGTHKTIAESVNRETTLNTTLDDVEKLQRHLALSQLTQVLGDEGLAFLTQKAKMTHNNWLQRTLKNYLLFRIPLLHPNRMLDHFLPKVSWFFSKHFLIVVLLSAVVGLLLILRKWDYFAATLIHSLAMGDLFPYGMALVISKSLHELAHAFTAKRFGCRVPVMGVALLLLWPILYTETSEAWKRSSRNQRLAVGGAGILAELALASIATLMWNFLPDGDSRNAAFFLATALWILTLAVNLNPLMRFDGYFLLSDFLEIPNLHERAFAFGRWSLRETLFGLNDPPPEQLPKRWQHFLVFFALATWIYRFFLFFGIALLVYHFFFKALALILFSVEIGWFIVRPVFLEIRFWIHQHHRMQMNGHTLISSLFLLFFLTGLLMPWPSTVQAPAILKAVRHTNLFAPQAARLETPLPSVNHQVKKGDVLVRLYVPDLAYKENRLLLEIDLLKWQIASKGREHRFLEQERSLNKQLSGSLTELEAVRQEQKSLTLVAPFSATVTSRMMDTTPGEWVSAGEKLLGLVDPSEQIIEAFVAGDHADISPHAKALFYPEDIVQAPLPCQLKTLDKVNTQRLREGDLTSRYGGPILIREEIKEAWIPREAYFRMTLSPTIKPPPLKRTVRGTVAISTPPESIAGRMWRAFSILLIRESGF